MKKVITTSLVAMSLIFSSCGSSEEEPTKNAKVRVEVVNHPLEIDPNQPVSNATVLIYGSTNFEAEPVFKGVTNTNGVVEFTKNVELGKTYYIDVEKSCKNNYNSLVYGYEADYTTEGNNFEDDDLNTKTISIMETGTVVLTNQSANGYLVKILDKAIGTIAVGETLTFENMPVNSSLYSLVNIDTNEALTLESLAICGDTKEYTIN